VADALFELDGGRFVPSALTAGPWDPGSQHGGAPSALLARAIEAEPAPGPVQLSRLTVELLRPVPIAPLQVSCEVVRPGRKVQLVRAVLTAGDLEVAVAHGLRIRTTELPLPAGATAAEPALPGPDGGRRTRFLTTPAGGEAPGFHTTANEIRFVEGGFDGPGPALAWIRLLVPVVAGEEASPAMRVAAAADFGNGLSWVLPATSWLFVNPDLSIHLARPPRGEWIGLRSRTFPSAEGVGMAESELSDREGRIGRAVQSLLLDRRG
jgi:hypothetical protein